MRARRHVSPPLFCLPIILALALALALAVGAASPAATPDAFDVPNFAGTLPSGGPAAKATPAEYVARLN